MENICRNLERKKEIYNFDEKSFLRRQAILALPITI